MISRMGNKVDHSLFHFSITVFTKRREVLAALRGLSFAAQRKISPYTTWGGTDEASWKDRNYHARFYFTEAGFRDDFLAWAKELLQPGSWQQIGEPIDDDAMPAPKPNRSQLDCL